MARQPNILLVHSDQHRFDCLGVNGHPLVQTPNLDGLARGGVNFRNAFTPSPICSPARASLLTGTWPTQHGCQTIPYCCEYFNPADAKLPVLTNLLAGAGYVIGYVGKFHCEVAGGPTDYGVETYVGTGEYRKWREIQHLAPQPRANGLFGEVDPHIRPEQSPLAFGADQIVTLMRRYAQGDKPFVLRWDPPEPHLPNVVPEPYASMYPPESIAPWPSFPDPLIGKPHAQQRTRQRWRVDDWKWENWAPIVSRYLGEITLLDHQLGRILTELNRLGLEQETLVIYTTDHGDMCGGHGMMDKHYCMYDDIMHVPLIAKWPGVLLEGQMCDAMVVHELDVATTLLKAGGVEPPASFLGRDLVADALGRGPAGREDVFAQYFGTQQGLFSERMVRTRDWKYVYNPAAEDELYDLQRDPAELRNLAGDAACAGRLQGMQERMGRWMSEVRDPLSAPLWRWK